MKFCLSVATILATTGAAHASTSAYSFEGGRSLVSATGSVNLVQGWEFTVNEDVFATALGYFDAGNVTASGPPDGLFLSKDVGLFDSSGTLIAQGVVPAGTDGTLVDGWRYVTIDDTLLTAGESYTVASFTPEGEFTSQTFDARPSFINNWIFSLTDVRPPEIFFDGTVNFVQSRFEIFSPGLEFPTRTSDNFGRLAGANFLFKPVPTPGAAGLAVVAAPMTLRRRRR